MKNEIRVNETIKKGDTVSWNEHPQIISEVVEIKKSHFLDVDMYHTKNGNAYELHEITKAK